NKSMSGTCRNRRQKWSNMSNLGRSHHHRWRGVALGGHLQRGCRFCLAAHDGQATSGQIAEWCRPEIVYAGGKPTAIQIAKHARAALDRRTEGPAGGAGMGVAIGGQLDGGSYTKLTSFE